MRVVVDTNIIVSAYLGGALETLLRALVAGKFTLVVSTAIAEEYFRVLRRPKFGISAEELADFISLLFLKAEFVTPQEVVEVVEEDPSDNKFLSAALQSKADYIASGDNHLLGLKTFRGIPIITAREFLKLLSFGSPHGEPPGSEM